MTKFMTDIEKYNKFLETKKNNKIESGFNVDYNELNPILFDFQKYCVKIALKVGKFALFEDCGLGKTIQQLEWADKVYKHIKKPIIILAPLAVVSQTIEEANKFGYNISEYNSKDCNSGIYITNYENIDNIDASLFGGVVLDES